MIHKSINYNQSGARERGVEMLATAVARLLNRCACMNNEVRLRFMARLLDKMADVDSGQRSGQPINFSLEAVMQSAQDDPDRAVDEAAVLLTRSLSQEQGLNRDGLFRFYDALFELLIPRGANPRAA